MAKRLSEAAAEGVSNSESVRKDIKKQVDMILKGKKQRATINANINACRKKITALGVPVSALNYAIRQYEMDPDDRETHNDMLQVALEGLGIPMAPVG